MRVFVAIFWLAAAAFASDPMEDPNLFEGDMDLKPEQRLEIELSAAGLPTFGASKTQNWPKSIPYQIDSSIGSDGRAVGAIHAAISEYHSKTCLRFRPRTSSDRAYINFRSGTGCSSPVGYWGGVNDIKLASGCWTMGIVAHEIMHSLGFYHEQSRPDRDNFVRIRWENIPGGTGNHNFKKYSFSHIDSMGSPYDYDSVMHYSSTAFGGGKTTIEGLQSGSSQRMGQRRQLSPNDVWQVRRKYGC